MKRTFAQLEEKRYQSLIEYTPKIYISSKKFYFAYSKHKDGKHKAKSNFLHEFKDDVIPNFSLNYDKENEILTIPRFRESVMQVYNDIRIKEFLDEKVNDFMEEKAKIRERLTKKKIKKVKTKKKSKQEIINERIRF